MKKIIILIFSTISLLNISSAKWFDIDVNEGNFPYEEERADSMKDILQHSDAGDIADNFVGSDIKTQNSPIAYYVSKVINYFLVILGIIAFLSLLYGFSLVFTDKSDEGIKKGYKFIKIAAIAIIVIGVSWLFSIWIFYIYNNEVVK